MAAAAAPVGLAAETRQHYANVEAAQWRQLAGAEPTFSGAVTPSKATGLETTQWVKKMEQWFRVAHMDSALHPAVPESERLLLLGSALTGAALTWWDSNQALPAGDAASITTWAAFTAALTQRFQLVHAGTALRTRLAALGRRGGQTVTTYTDAFLEIQSLLPTMGDEEARFAYLNGLHSVSAQVHTILAPQLLPTLREVVAAATRTEAALATTGASASSSSGGSGYSNNTHNRFARFGKNNAARLHKMEADGNDAAVEALIDALNDMPLSTPPPTAELNATGTGSGSGSGGSWRNSRPPPGGKRGPSMHPENTPGLSNDFARQRRLANLCVRCGRPGHWKGECKNEAYIAQVKNPTPSGK